MRRHALILVALALTHADGRAQPPAATREALIARAKSLELDTPYEPPPGDPLSHHTAGYVKVVCSGVFVTGLEPDFAAENLGYFVAPPRCGPGSAGRSWTGKHARTASPCRTA